MENTKRRYQGIDELSGDDYKIIRFTDNHSGNNTVSVDVVMDDKKRWGIYVNDKSGKVHGLEVPEEFINKLLEMYETQL